MFETLVSLAILVAIISIATTALRPPSPSLLLDKKVSELAKTVSSARNRAVRNGKPVSLEAPGCDNRETVELLFFPEGTAWSNGQICIQEGSIIRIFRLTPLTGELKPEAL